MSTKKFMLYIFYILMYTLALKLMNGFCIVCSASELKNFCPHTSFYVLSVTKGNVTVSSFALLFLFLSFFFLKRAVLLPCRPNMVVTAVRVSFFFGDIKFYRQDRSVCLRA